MCAGTKEQLFGSPTHELDAGGESRSGFTLVELLVVVGIVSVLMGILMPALGMARRQAKAILGSSNQRQIIGAVGCYAADNEDRYPLSVATVGTWPSFNWTEPTTLVGYKKLTPQLNRSMSTYLGSYVSEGSVFSCPSAPKEHTYLQDAWEAGEDWANPEMPIPMTPLSGTYCFYWNYDGYLGGERVVFRGPGGPMGGRRESKLLVSCYLGSDHWRSRKVYSSCERFGGAGVTDETWMASAYWSGRDADDSVETIEIKPRAGYTDGHVESYSSSDVAPMEVIQDPVTNEPYYPPQAGPGIFYLPQAALY